ncbi:hypothetical protein HCU64_01595 [Methylobacterium sp. C25]|uniref:GCG_CRPN prefix-to-repeats domain-containing protein n=1 Tax=Methylobacterium sp. C25 TaxID=2721622 RepID=UPI001F2F2C8E|nr:hypothetical protein [Methylobacterium sp. C25]MCE4222432.1 hypothetical protein [Methylobacterium sp. C25]
MTHLKIFATAATLAAGLGLATSASAAPLSPGLIGATDGANVERVAGGCGPGFHPNPWGVCRPNFYGPRPFYGRPVYRPYGYYRPRPYYRPYGFYGPRPFF